MIPWLLTAAYLAVLIIRFPDLISWLNTSSDVASAYVLTNAVSHGQTGQVVMSTQGAWAPLWYGLLTHGLSFHRVLWEISPALLTLISASVIGWSVARVATRAAGCLTLALIVSASPTGLASFAAPWVHNTTLAGVALLGAFLIWLHDRPHGIPVLVGSTVVLSVVIGVFLASDALLWIEGLLPFLIAPLLIAARSRNRTGVRPVVAVAVGAVLADALTSAVMHALNFTTVGPPLQHSAQAIPVHLKWLAQGLLRMGNGLSLGSHTSIWTPLVVAAALVTICALLTTLKLGREHVANAAAGTNPTRTLHVTFWSTSLVCAATAYVLTTRVATDRYFVIAIPTVAATVPLLLDRGRASRLIALGASIFIMASTWGLLTDIPYGSTARAGRQMDRIAALVRSRHLGVGYAGYWEAAPLDWISHGRLRVYPLTQLYGPTQPMELARVAAWYRPSPNTPSYLLLTRGDSTFADRVPPDLPKPRYEIRVGRDTLAVYPYDVAAYLHPPVN